MQTNVRNAVTLSFSVALAGALVAGCTDTGVEPDEERRGVPQEPLAGDRDEGGESCGVAALPSFEETPNIKQAANQLPELLATAVARTVSGFQIYRCEQGAMGPEWKLRTPLATLTPSPDVDQRGVNEQRLEGLVASYHYRSDFGGLLAAAQIEAMGLASPPVNAPVWDFTFQKADEAPRHEVLAARLVAQDTPVAGHIPFLLLEIRGRAIDPGTATVLADTTHMLRWATRGGLAPAAGCTTATLGRESQSPYVADYYFLTPK
jgi:hypothetical protein